MKKNYKRRQKKENEGKKERTFVIAAVQSD